MGYQLLYGDLVGGVLAIRREHFQHINGYSNMYWGWGAEDDDLSRRLIKSGLKITNPPDTIGRYNMIKHNKSQSKHNRQAKLKRIMLLLQSTDRMHADGLSSVNYTLQFVHKLPLYTHVMVNLGKPPPCTSFPKVSCEEILAEPRFSGNWCQEIIGKLQNKTTCKLA